MTDVLDGTLLPGYSVEPESGAWCTLPWPGDPLLPYGHPDRIALLPPSLGPQVIAWAEKWLIHHLTGDPWRFTTGQRRFLHLWYATKPDGRWLYRSGVKRGAKGSGKDPLFAAWCLCELGGPVRVHDVDDRTSAPVGHPHRHCLVQIAANSEAQAKDVLAVANAMISPGLRAELGVDAGITRTLTHAGSAIELLTSSEKSSEGDPATAIGINESHHMTESNGGHAVAAVAARNAAKSPTYAPARLLEFTNAHQQGADSVAERSFEAWQSQQRPDAKRRDILYDSREAPPTTDLYDDDSRMAGLRAAYWDSPWSDLETISDTILDTRTSVADTIRYYLNGLGAAEDAWIDPRRFDAMADATKVVADGDRVAMFLDCSKSSDATGLVGCRLEDMHVFVLGSWQRPHGDRGKGWLAPREQVDATGRQAFRTYDVVWAGIDPSPAKDDDTETLYWRDLIDGWHRDFGTELPVWATPGRQGNGVLFDMRLSQPGGSERNRLFTEMAMATAHDIDEEDRPWTHDGDSVLRVHTHNARCRPNQWGVSLGKVTRDSSKLVDLAVCMVGARMGARLALNSGKLKPKKAPSKAYGF